MARFDSVSTRVNARASFRLLFSAISWRCVGIARASAVPSTPLQRVIDDVHAGLVDLLKRASDVEEFILDMDALAEWDGGVEREPGRTVRRLPVRPSVFVLRMGGGRR